MYSADRDPIPLPSGQDYLQVDDDPTSSVVIGTAEVTDDESVAESEMVATDADTGERLWRRADAWPVARLAGRLVASAETGLVGIDEVTGAQEWSLPSQAWVAWPPVGAGSVLMGSAADLEALVAIDIRTGEPVWEAPTDGWWGQMALTATGCTRSARRAAMSR
ncbi:outer membrane protein assembly factor BamB family protein [Occultella aeris]|uniref:outer membrane protein assembly factor BamB family protein n=1 Tax=Occultella aeris TaxID=2761496 RepID=UPI0012EA5FE1|nr:PQQ-binding-like beta-propeller repeat protein [Occultella aeris]